MLFFTIMLLLFPILVYASFAEIRESTNGILCIILVATQIFQILLVPFIEIDNHQGFILFVMSYIGAFSSNICINVMCYDIYLTFKHFREPQYHSQYFKKFMMCLLSVVILIMLFITITTREMPSFRTFIVALYVLSIFIFFLAIFLDIFALISCFYYLIALRRSTATSDNTRLDVERER